MGGPLFVVVEGCIPRNGQFWYNNRKKMGLKNKYSASHPTETKYNPINLKINVLC